MCIHEAVQKAMECNGYFYRNSSIGKPVRYWGVNKRNPVSVIAKVQPESVKIARCWNPTPDDLMANDWEVTKELGFSVSQCDREMLRCYPQIDSPDK